MATAKQPGDEPDVDFDQLFAGEQPAAKGQAGKENLQELEAFLDEFEKNLGEPKPAAATPASAAPAEAAPSFTEPHAAEELVHGLLKEDELNLDVQASAPPAAQVPEFEPQPLKAPALDIPAFIHAAPAANGKPVPAAAAGFSRIGFILALVLGGTALLVAIGAGWMALNASQAIKGLEMRGGAASPAQDQRLAKLQTDITALHKQVDELSKSIGGSMTELGTRVAALEKATGIAPAAATEAPPPQATAKGEPPKVAAQATPATPPVTPGRPNTEAKGPAGSGQPPPAAARNPAAPTAPPANAAAQPPKPAVPPSPAPAQSGKAAGAASAAPQGATPTAPATPAAQGGAPANGGTVAPQLPAPAPAPAPDKPVAKAKPAAPKGGWMVHLTSSDERPRAQAQLDHARAKGLTARLTTGTVGGKTWYRVTVEGFASAEEARAFVGKQALDAGFNAAWIAKR